MVRPSLFKELWVKRAQKIIVPALRKNIPVVFHSCGNVMELMPTLIEMGISCYHPCEPTSGADIYECKKKYGNKICLRENIDSAGVLLSGTPEEVEKDVKEHIDKLSPGGGYVLSSSHSIMNHIPHENFLAMIKTCHTYGKYR